MREITFREAIIEAQAQELERDPKVFLMGEDVRLSTFGTTVGLYEKFGPERIRDTPISELGFVGAGVGAAMAGYRPIVDMMIASFMFVAMDQICNQAAKVQYMSGGQMRLPLTFRAGCGLMSGAGAQHSETMYTSFLGTPGLKIVVPSNPYDAKGLLKSAIRDDNPVLFFEALRLYGKKGPVPEDDYLVPLGKAAVVQPGSDVTIIAFGYMMELALKAAASLAKDNISAEVVDLRTLVPLDTETVLSSVRKTGRVVIVDEAHRTGSMASEVAACIAEGVFDFLKAPIKRVATADMPVPFSPTLEEYLFPTAEKIVAAASELLQSRRTQLAGAVT